MFQPTLLGAITLANRIVMAPLTRARSFPERRPGSMAVNYYRERSAAGLIVSEGTSVSPMSVGYADTPGLWRQDQVEAWAAVTRAVHEAAGKIVSQLWHVGRRSHPSLLPGEQLPVAPSAIAIDDRAYTYGGFQPMPMARALETHEVPGIIEEFAKAAANAHDAGFDGIELHAANGYLFDQFLRDGSNTREDHYGGSVDGRMTFLREVVDAIGARIGFDRIGVKLSPLHTSVGMDDRDPEALFIAASRMLGERRIAYLHIAGNVSPPTAHAKAINPRPLFAAMRQAFGRPYVANSGYTSASATAAISDGTATAVAFGKPFLANPDLVNRFRSHAALSPELPKEQWYGGGARGYADQAPALP